MTDEQIRAVEIIDAAQSFLIPVTAATPVLIGAAVGAAIALLPRERGLKALKAIGGPCAERLPDPLSILWAAREAVTLEEVA